MTDQLVSRSTARDALVNAAVDHLSRLGPAGLQPQEICRELGMSKALVNYHFGSRDGLIAEAMVLGYEAYLDESMEAALAAGPDPVDRLMAWMEHQAVWTAEHRGLAAALDFPDMATEPAARSVDPSLAQRLAAIGTRSAANLHRLVHAARVHVRPELADAEPGDESGHTRMLVAWLGLGMAVWMGGNPLPTRIAGVRELLPFPRERLRAALVAMLSA